MNTKKKVKNKRKLFSFFLFQTGGRRELFKFMNSMINFSIRIYPYSWVNRRPNTQWDWAVSLWQARSFLVGEWAQLFDRDRLGLATMPRRLLSSWSLVGHRRTTIRFVADVRLASQLKDRGRIRFRLSLVFHPMRLRLAESSRRAWSRRQWWLGPHRQLVRSLLLLSLSLMVFPHLLLVFLKIYFDLELD